MHPIYKTGAEVPPGPPDPRDYQWADSGLGGATPSAARLQYIMPAMAQRWLDCGPCTVRAMVYTATGSDVSARYCYLLARKQAGTYPNLGGTYAPINMSVAAKGIAETPVWPYEGEPNETPTPAADANAATHKITYYATPTLQDIQSAIASGHAVGIHVYATDMWYAPLWREDGWAEIPQGGNAIGGHFVCVVGYDMQRKNADGTVGAILILNSWGDGWGSRGLAWLPLYWLTPAGGHAGSRYAITSQRPAPPMTPKPDPMPPATPVEPTPTPTPEPEKPMLTITKCESMPANVNGITTVAKGKIAYFEWASDADAVDYNVSLWNNHTPKKGNDREQFAVTQDCVVTLKFTKAGAEPVTKTFNITLGDAKPDTSRRLKFTTIDHASGVITHTFSDDSTQVIA